MNGIMKLDRFGAVAPDRDRRPPPGWFQSGLKWVESHLPRTFAARLAALEPFIDRSRQDAPSHGTVHLRNGDRIAIEIDAENGAYLRDDLRKWGSEDIGRVAWFETIDGCLLGLNLTQVTRICWGPPAPAAAEAAAWDRDHVVVHFDNGETIALPRIGGEKIGLLRGATIANRGRAGFHVLPAEQNEQMSINLDTLTYVTMPAIWLDDDS